MKIRAFCRRLRGRPVMRTPPINPKVIATLPVFVSVSLAVAAVWALGMPQLVMPLVLGIIAGGLVDLDNGLTGRLKNIFFTAALFSVSSLSVQLTMGSGLPFIVTMTGLTLALTLLGAVGLRYRTIAFGALAVACYTTLAYTPQTPWLRNPVLILLGTLLYSSITLVLHIVFPHRPVQEKMAAAFAALGSYFDAKAAFFDPDEVQWLERRRLDLAMKNSAVTEAFNQCRSALFYRMRGQHRHPRTVRMLRYYFTAQDMHERVSSSHMDYQELAERLKNTDLIFRIHRLLELQAQACRDVDKSLRDGVAYAYGERLARAIEGCRQSLKLYAAQRSAAQVHTLQRLLDNLFAIDWQLSHLEGDGAGHYGELSDKTRIAAQEQEGLRHALRTLREQFGLHSAVFRHAVRLSLVVLLSCAVVELLHLQLGYWILLTALFVCQPNYSATKSRVAQRVAGTVLGVLVGSALPWFTPSVETKLVIIVLATTLFFFSRNYKYSWSTFFITLQALTSLSLLGMDVYAAMPLRITDTVIGAGIAWAAVYFLWPDWRYVSLESAAAQSVASNGAYLRQILHQLQHGSADDVAYRSVRRRAHEDAAALSSALSNMGSHPAKYGARLQAGFNLLKTSYALTGYISALGAYRQHMASGGAQQAAFMQGFFSLAGQVADTLERLGTLGDEDFAAASARISSGLQALHAHIQDQRQNSILWQQIDLIARQLAPVRALLRGPAGNTGAHGLASATGPAPSPAASATSATPVAPARNDAASPAPGTADAARPPSAPSPAGTASHNAASAG